MSTVSIVIPTRNRAHLLRSALRSALSQTYRPLEVVVCDNASTDDTQDFMQSARAENLTYIRTDRVLSMPDNWEFALKHAKGEFVTYLADDCYLLSDAIRIAVRELDRFHARVAVWGTCCFFAADWFEPAWRNLVAVPTARFDSYLVESRVMLRGLYARDRRVFREAYTMVPRSLNSLCHRSIIERIAGVQGRFFLPPCPDYTSAAAVLWNVPEYLVIDRPLYIEGVTPHGIGASCTFNVGEKVREFAGEFKGGLNDVAYLGVLTIAGCIAKSLENVRGLYADSALSLDPRVWLCAMMDELVKARINGGDVADYWDALRRHIVRQPRSIRLRAAKQRVVSHLKWGLARMLRSSPRMNSIEMLRNLIAWNNTHFFRGQKAGFQNIEDCATVLEDRIFPSMRQRVGEAVDRMDAVGQSP